MKSIKESIVKHSVNESRVRNEEDAIKAIVTCLYDNEILDDICEAADRGAIDIKSFTDRYGKEILGSLNEALLEWWDENY